MSNSPIRHNLQRALAGDNIKGSDLLSGVGGVRGILEAVLPGIAFLLAYVLTESVFVSAAIPLTVATLAIVIRLLQRQQIKSGIYGLVGVAVSATSMLLTRRAEDFFLPSILAATGYALVLFVSVAVRRPLFGYALSFVDASLASWRTTPQLRRLANLLTLSWAGMFLSRTVIQTPLLLAGHVETLALVRLVMGIPLTVLTLWVSWVLVKSYAAKNAS